MPATINPEAGSSLPRAAHFAISTGCTALAGVATGLEVGLLERSPDIGVYLGLADTPVIAFITLVAVNAWEAFHATPDIVEAN
ncbi:MAG TPA: hypothetical protein VNG32_03150 [Candidatus Dormibacteraeota bacterium]|nr:hypothetical protein [Candidatus Dormibacteraeota bacterium]